MGRMGEMREKLLTTLSLPSPSSSPSLCTTARPQFSMRREWGVGEEGSLTTHVHNWWETFATLHSSLVPLNTPNS